MRQEKEEKLHKWKWRTKAGLVTNDTFIYVENPKESIKKKNPQTNIDYSNVTKYKVNTQKSTTFLYTNNEQVKFKIKNIIPFTLAPPKMKQV